MAIKINHLNWIVLCFVLLAYTFGMAAQFYMPGYGTPVKTKNGVTCKFSYDTATTLVYISIAFLVASNVIGSLSLFYPKKESFIPPMSSNKCIIWAVISTGVAASMLLWPLIFVHLSSKVHHDLNYACPTYGILIVGVFLLYLPGFFWSGFFMGRKDFPEHVQIRDNVAATVLDSDPISAPRLIADEIIPIDDLTNVHYDQSVVVDLSHVVDVSSPSSEKLPEEEGGGGNAAGDGSGGSICVICLAAPREGALTPCGHVCVICLAAPREGACIPCGHVAGCMSCLNKVKEKEWDCPVCRAKINEVIKLYPV